MHATRTKRRLAPLGAVAIGAVAIGAVAIGAVAIGLGAPGAALASDPAAVDPHAASRGAELLAPFKRDLKQALTEGLAEGPVQAVGACQLRAPEIAAALSRDGVRVGRASHRLRNPRNAPPDWVKPVLSAYLDDPGQRTPRTVSTGQRRTGYVEPIMLGAMCLTCHGSVLDPAVSERIDRLYPDDEAVGFEVGELRGVFWVEFPDVAGPDDADNREAGNAD